MTLGGMFDILGNFGATGRELCIEGETKVLEGKRDRGTQVNILPDLIRHRHCWLRVPTRGMVRYASQCRR